MGGVRELPELVDLCGLVVVDVGVGFLGHREQLGVVEIVQVVGSFFKLGLGLEGKVFPVEGGEMATGAEESEGGAVGGVGEGVGAEGGEGEVEVLAGGGGGGGGQEGGLGEGVGFFVGGFGEEVALGLLVEEFGTGKTTDGGADFVFAFAKGGFETFRGGVEVGGFVFGTAEVFGAGGGCVGFQFWF